MFFYYSLDYEVDMHRAYILFIFEFIYICVLQRNFSIILLHPSSTAMVRGGLSFGRVVGSGTRVVVLDATLRRVLSLSLLPSHVNTPSSQPKNGQPSHTISKSTYEIVEVHAEQHQQPRRRTATTHAHARRRRDLRLRHRPRHR